VGGKDAIPNGWICVYHGGEKTRGNPDKELYNVCVDPTDISCLPQRLFESFKKSTVPNAHFKRKKRTAIYSERGGGNLSKN
jgi:hypothetical protein